MASQENIGQTRLRFISGGQTGVDRAALDFAIEHGYRKLPRSANSEVRHTNSKLYFEFTNSNL